MPFKIGLKHKLKALFFPSRLKPFKLAFPPELCESDRDLISVLLSPEAPASKLTLLSCARLVSASLAVEYVVRSQIPGDLVECGVWRGGTSILMANKLKSLYSDKILFMYDTFTGMTMPSSVDINTSSGENALDIFISKSRVDHNEWCFASYDDVLSNLQRFDVVDIAKLVKGPVEKTLLEPSNLPNQISLLRLDTDWYDSTLVELKVLYPLVSPGGVILIDDYGHWDGARKAVDEFFCSLPSHEKPLMWITDRSGRGFIKPSHNYCK